MIFPYFHILSYDFPIVSYDKPPFSMGSFSSSGFLSFQVYIAQLKAGFEAGFGTDFFGCHDGRLYVCGRWKSPEETYGLIYVI